MTFNTISQDKLTYSTPDELFPCPENFASREFDFRLGNLRLAKLYTISCCSELLPFKVKYKMYIKHENFDVDGVIMQYTGACAWT